MTNKEMNKCKLLHAMETLDYFKNNFFDEESINFMLLQTVTDNIIEVYNYDNKNINS